VIKIQLRFVRILLYTQGINRVMRNIILRRLVILAPTCNDFFIVQIRMHAARMHAPHNSDDAHTQDNIGSVALRIHFTRYNSFSSVTIVYNNSTITLTMSRRGSEDESDTEGESELQRLREEVMSLRAEKGVKLSTSKKSLRKELRGSSEGLVVSEEFSEFIVQYLFPRFKFLHDGWNELDNSDRNSFSSVVRRHYPLKPGRDFADDWLKIFVPSLAVKYTQLRCNVNNAIRDAFKGAYAV
jgi:hypothetical protein